MRNLLSVSLCFLLLACSCAPSLTKGCRKGEPVWLAKEEIPPMLPLSDRMQKYTMTIDFMRKHFSGLLVVKQTQSGTCRILFSTHFGLSLFDLEIGRDSLQVHHCIEPLNKKKILNLLGRDFTVLSGFSFGKVNKAIPYICTDSPDRKIYYVEGTSIKGYYRKDLPDGQVREIRIGSGLRKTTFRSQPGTTGKPTSFRIRHTGLRLSIGLDALP